MKNLEINILASPSLIDDCISVGQMLHAIDMAEPDADISAKIYTDYKVLLNDEAAKPNNPDTAKIMLALLTEAEYTSDDEDAADVDQEIMLRFSQCFGLKDEKGDGATFSYLKMLKDTAPSPQMGAFAYDGSDSLCINAVMHLIALDVLDISDVSIDTGWVFYKSVRVGNMGCTRYIQHNSALKDNFDLDTSARDAMYLDIFRNATLFARLTYTVYDDEAIDTMLKDFYNDSKVYDKDSLIEICDNQWSQRAEFIRIMTINIHLDKLNEMITAAAAKGASAITDTDLNAAIAMFEATVDFASTFDCPADWQCHLFNEYVIFLCNKELYETAYPLSQKLLAIAESGLDLKDRGVYKSYYVAGVVANGLNKKEEAFPLFEKYLSYALDEFDETWESVRDTYHTLAVQCIKDDDYDSAYIFSGKVMEICEMHPPVTPKDKENLSIYLSIYAHSLKELRRTDEAIELYKKCLALQYESTDNDQLTLGVLYDNLANCYDDLRQYDVAIGYHLKAAELLERLSGPMCPDLHVVYFNVAICYSNLGMHAKASEYFDKSDTIFSLYHPLV